MMEWTRFDRPPCRCAIWAIVVLLALGCAPQQTVQNDVDPAAEATIVVNNDLLPRTSLTIWVVPEVGSRSMLGTVTPGDTESFRHEVVGPAGQYRLMARTATGAEIVSNPFTPVPGETVRWDLHANVVR